jgi:Tfp pilus assembly protein PilV
VELLVAVTILAIIIIPLMHLFLTSSRLNIKSRKTLRATTVAQDIMEGLKAYDIEELKSQFNNPGDGFYVINDGIIKGGVGEDTSREAAEVGTDAVSGDPNPGYYCFTMKNITLQGSEYDARVMIDGRDYMESGTHTANQSNTDASGTPQAHNNSGFAAVSAILEDKDGSHIEKSSYLTDDLKEIYNNTTLKPLFEAAGITQAADLTYQLVSGMTVSKDYILDITDDGTDEDGNAKANVKVTVQYEISYGAATPETVMGVTRDPCDFVSGGSLYFFYYPLYEAVDECITVNNTANIPLNLTIAKQVYSSADDTDPFLLSDAKLNAAEKKYTATVNICGGSKDQTKIRTNLGTNLTNSTYLSGAGEPTDVPGQVIFQYNGAAVTSLNVFTLSGVRNTSLGATGADNEITEVIYDVTVEVYQAGADFDSDSPMVSIEGSMNN